MNAAPLNRRSGGRQQKQQHGTYLIDGRLIGTSDGTQRAKQAVQDNRKQKLMEAKLMQV